MYILYVCFIVIGFFFCCLLALLYTIDINRSPSRHIPQEDDSCA